MDFLIATKTHNGDSSNSRGAREQGDSFHTSSLQASLELQQKYQNSELQ